jgi:hypothetical protein
MTGDDVGVATSADTVSACDVRVLGDLEVVGPGGPAEIRSGLPRILFDMLAVRANDVVPPRC